jgi:hypothetical protein
MNTQQRMVESKTFRIAVIAVAAAVLLAAAAYLFGTGLRADTSASVAPSPLGSSLTNSRQSVAVAPASLGASSLEIPSPASVAALAAVGESRSEDFYGRSSASSSAIGSADGRLPWIKPEGVQTSGAVSESPWIKPEGIKTSGDQ